ncbi:hypothetical protein MANY_36260 [Mycolicibacterium anyangense]|uniref:Uncharacterized protein n=1 Tax=Mycolicibacterium anyangense TaxID=1431246 RepID=A0A6N4WB74_9MYCO|nr:hypothetical protein [Mycolicibacterium anyangense]BBZ78289.1 hypothetical protein MANY_36260 [Mycolicibacterium anyangense]
MPSTEVRARQTFDAFGLLCIGEIGRHQKELRAAVAVAYSHQLHRISVCGDHPIAGIEQGAGKGESALRAGVWDEHDR